MATEQQAQWCSVCGAAGHGGAVTCGTCGELLSDEQSLGCWKVAWSPAWSPAAVGWLAAGSSRVNSAVGASCTTATVVHGSRLERGRQQGWCALCGAEGHGCAVTCSSCGELYNPAGLPAGLETKQQDQHYGGAADFVELGKPTAGSMQIQKKWQKAGAKARTVAALKPPEHTTGLEAHDWHTEMLMPTEVKVVGAADRCRKWILWGSLSTSYANFLIYLASNEDIIDLPKFWLDNRDRLMILNYVLFVIGVLTFLYFSYYTLVTKHKRVADGLLDGTNAEHGFKWSRLYGFLWAVTVHLVLLKPRRLFCTLTFSFHILGPLHNRVLVPLPRELHGLLNPI
eukprot:SAG31_NODE_8347_length_1468_cov_2.041636_1_plen_341_part_00